MLSVLQTDAFPLGDPDIGSLDGSCTRSSLTENQSDFSICPQGY
jgi:hypothetical protein